MVWPLNNGHPGRQENCDSIVAFKQNVSHIEQDTGSSCLATSDTVYADSETTWKYRLNLVIDDTSSVGESTKNRLVWKLR